MIACKTCGVEMAPRPSHGYHGKPQTYCSRRCAGLSIAVKPLVQKRLSFAKVVPYIPKPKRNKCVCSVPSRGKYCSRKCRSKAQHQLTGTTHRQRARRRGVAYEYFKVAEVYERDGWQCWLCEQPIDKLAKYPAPLSPSIDHVIPLSLGGTHTRDNVAASHFYCNSLKGNAVLDRTPHPRITDYLPLQRDPFAASYSRADLSNRGGTHG